MNDEATFAQRVRRAHREVHPYCTYGDQPHYVGPSFGQVGFYLCEADEAQRQGTTLDVTNRSRRTHGEPEAATSPVASSPVGGEQR